MGIDYEGLSDEAREAFDKGFKLACGEAYLDVEGDSGFRAAIRRQAEEIARLRELVESGYQKGLLKGLEICRASVTAEEINDLWLTSGIREALRPEPPLACGGIIPKPSALFPFGCMGAQHVGVDLASGPDTTGAVIVYISEAVLDEETPAGKAIREDLHARMTQVLTPWANQEEDRAAANRHAPKGLEVFHMNTATPEEKAAFDQRLKDIIADKKAQARALEEGAE